MARRQRADPIAQAFGEAVRRIRKDRGETIEDLAPRASLAPKYLNELELGWHAPSIVTAKRLADALEVSLAELLSES